MDNISMGLNESNNSPIDIRFIRVSVNIPIIAVKFPNFYRTFLFSYPDFFARLI